MFSNAAIINFLPFSSDLLLSSVFQGFAKAASFLSSSPTASPTKPISQRSINLAGTGTRFNSSNGEDGIDVATLDGPAEGCRCAFFLIVLQRLPQDGRHYPSVWLALRPAPRPTRSAVTSVATSSGDENEPSA